MTTYVFTLTCGCISWRSTVQKCISLSSTKDKYVATAEATKEAIWLNKLITEMGMPKPDVNLHCDSQNALQITSAFISVVDSCGFELSKLVCDFHTVIIIINNYIIIKFES